MKHNPNPKARHCKECGSELDPERPRYHAARCRPCWATWHREYQAAHRKPLTDKQRAAHMDRKARWYRDNVGAKDRAKDYNLRRTYGISLRQMQEMLAAQGGGCAICGTTEPTKMGGWGKARRTFTVDHDHTTGAIRGILCGHCNAALGLFRDNALAVRRALEYLQRHAGAVAA